MPYRIDISAPPDHAVDYLVQLGALDIEPVDAGLAAIIPDAVTAEAVAAALGVANVAVSAAIGRDNGSVWILHPRPLRIRGAALRLTDSAAFGSGHHPTTSLCIDTIEEAVAIAAPDSILDVGTGSGVLALAALLMGVPKAVGVDIDAEAVKIAAKHARLNNLEHRLELLPGGPEVAAGVWPLVIANVLAAPLIEMAPVLVRRVAPRGRLILSGIASSLESEVTQAYQQLGMRHIRSETRSAWNIVIAEASW